MSKEFFTVNYDSATGILTGKVLVPILEKEQAKKAHEMTVEAINKYNDYKDYILDISLIGDDSPDSVGYMVKTLGIIKKTAGYMVLVIREDIVQKFMLSNPEMFDMFAFFFTLDDAIKFVLSKR